MKEINLQVEKLLIKLIGKNLCGDIYSWSDKDWKSGLVDYNDAYRGMQETVIRCGRVNLFSYEEYADPFIGEDYVVIVGAKNKDEAIDIGILRILKVINKDEQLTSGNLTLEELEDMEDKYNLNYRSIYQSFITKIGETIGPDRDLERFLRDEILERTRIYKGAPVGVPMDEDGNRSDLEGFLREILIAHQEKGFTGYTGEHLYPDASWYYYDESDDEILEGVDKEFKVNEYLSVKFGTNRNSESGTVIYIDNRAFVKCRSSLLLNISIKEIKGQIDTGISDEIKSIDELAENFARANCNYYKEEKFGSKEISYDISYEDEFWGICSNLQVWAENSYDIRLLHSKIAFKLLKELADVGDTLAEKVFREEVVKTFQKENLNLKHYLIINFFFTTTIHTQYLSIEELLTVITPTLKKLLKVDNDKAYEILIDLKKFFYQELESYHTTNIHGSRVSIETYINSLKLFEKEIVKLIQEGSCIVIVYLSQYLQYNKNVLKHLNSESIRSFLIDIEKIKNYSIKINIFASLILMMHQDLVNEITSNYSSIEKIFLDILNMIDKVNLDVQEDFYDPQYTLYNNILDFLDVIVDTKLGKAKLVNILETLYRLPKIEIYPDFETKSVIYEFLKLNKLKILPIDEKIGLSISLIKSIRETDMDNDNNQYLERYFADLFNEINKSQSSSFWIFRRVCDFIIQCRGTGLMEVYSDYSVIQEVINNLIKKHGTSKLSNKELKAINIFLKEPLIYLLEEEE
ncbi:hypothetical protein LCGC14_1295830 [marine sediment metagenome]|uniref:Uncharacterized protein n=1 Tax=marine sediment metagenome TaxID=412755 RepID=A0A0F9NTZ3_9ZZZZ